MKPLKKCYNGCDKPPKPPSKVLCEDCLGKISKKFDEMIQHMETKGKLS